MTVKYVIHLKQGYCSCFSDQDLAVNLKHAIAQGFGIVAVERVLAEAKAA